MAGVEYEGKADYTFARIDVPDSTFTSTNKINDSGQRAALGRPSLRSLGAGVRRRWACTIN